MITHNYQVRKYHKKSGKNYTIEMFLHLKQSNKKLSFCYLLYPAPKIIKIKSYLWKYFLA